MMLTPDAKNDIRINPIVHCMMEFRAEEEESEKQHSRHDSDEMSFDVQEALKDHDMHHVFETVCWNPDAGPIQNDEESATNSTPSRSNPSRPLQESASPNRPNPVRARTPCARAAARVDTAQHRDTSSSLGEEISEGNHHPTIAPAFAMGPPHSIYFPFQDFAMPRPISSLPSQMTQARREASRREAWERRQVAIRESMERLEEAMLKSAISHASVQALDRRNGVTRNQSKTMRNTERSRKQLQEGIMMQQLMTNSPVMTRSAYRSPVGRYGYM